MVVLGLVGGLLVVFGCPFDCLVVSFWWSFEVLLVVLLCPFGSLVGSFWLSAWVLLVVLLVVLCPRKSNARKKGAPTSQFPRKRRHDFRTGSVDFEHISLKSNMSSGLQRSTLQNFSGSLLKEPILERIFAPTIPGDLIFQFKSGKGLGCGV